jgi:hypothetical protein
MRLCRFAGIQNMYDLLLNEKKYIHLKEKKLFSFKENKNNKT